MLKIGSLFSGVGGLEMGVQAVLGGEVAWHAEIDPGACKVLAHRYPNTPNLGDITRVDWATVPPVNVLCAGFPCQDVSVAGAKAGLLRGQNRSGLWGETARAIATLRPDLVVLENVRGLLSAPADSDVEPCPWCLGDGSDEPHLRALGAVLADLADIGYDAWWIGLPASDIGAAHRRFRVFIFAVPADAKSDTWRLSDGNHGAAADASHVGHERGRPARDGRAGPAHGGEAAADPDSIDVRQQPVGVAGCSGQAVSARRDETAPDTDRDGLGGLGRVKPVVRDAHGRDGQDRPGPATEPAPPTDWGETAPDTIGGGRDRGARDPERGTVERATPAGDSATDWGQYGPDIERWAAVIGRPAPPPTELGPKGSHRLSARFTEWLMGWPDGWVTDVPGVTRNEALKCAGNGVVPRQAAEALKRWLAVVGAQW